MKSIDKANTYFLWNENKLSLIVVFISVVDNQTSVFSDSRILPQKSFDFVDFCMFFHASIFP